ncbi:MAG: hypothetical protein IT458_00295, partial [Planctomycetes bacterium]|nr:hypothetical protein [Planctomycetota bacterium]
MHRLDGLALLTREELQRWLCANRTTVAKWLRVGKLARVGAVAARPGTRRVALFLVRDAAQHRRLELRLRDRDATQPFVRSLRPAQKDALWKQLVHTGLVAGESATAPVAATPAARTRAGHGGLAASLRRTAAAARRQERAPEAVAPPRPSATDRRRAREAGRTRVAPALATPASAPAPAPQTPAPAVQAVDEGVLEALRAKAEEVAEEARLTAELLARPIATEPPAAAHPEPAFATPVPARRHEATGGEPLDPSAVAFADADEDGPTQHYFEDEGWHAPAAAETELSVEAIVSATLRALERSASAAPPVTGAEALQACAAMAMLVPRAEAPPAAPSIASPDAAGAAPDAFPGEDGPGPSVGEVSAFHEETLAEPGAEAATAAVDPGWTLPDFEIVEADPPQDAGGDPATAPTGGPDAPAGDASASLVPPGLAETRPDAETEGVLEALMAEDTPPPPSESFGAALPAFRESHPPGPAPAMGAGVTPIGPEPEPVLPDAEGLDPADAATVLATALPRPHPAALDDEPPPPAAPVAASRPQTPETAPIDLPPPATPSTEAATAPVVAEAPLAPVPVAVPVPALDPEALRAALREELVPVQESLAALHARPEAGLGARTELDRLQGQVREVQTRQQAVAQALDGVRDEVRTVRARVQSTHAAVEGIASSVRALEARAAAARTETAPPPPTTVEMPPLDPEPRTSAAWWILAAAAALLSLTVLWLAGSGRLGMLLPGLLLANV